MTGVSRPVRDDAIDQLEAVHAGHREIGDDRVKFLLRDLRECFVAGHRDVDGDPLARQPEADELAQLGVIVDDENPDLHAYQIPPSRRRHPASHEETTKPCGGRKSTVRSFVRRNRA